MNDESAVVRLTQRVRVKAHDRKTDFGVEFIKTFFRRQREARQDVGTGKTRRAVYDDAQKADKAGKAVNIGGKVSGVCPRCNGRGKLPDASAVKPDAVCPLCKGTGIIVTTVGTALKKRATASTTKTDTTPKTAIKKIASKKVSST